VPENPLPTVWAELTDHEKVSPVEPPIDSLTEFVSVVVSEAFRPSVRFCEFVREFEEVPDTPKVALTPTLTISDKPKLLLISPPRLHVNDSPSVVANPTPFVSLSPIVEEELEATVWLLSQFSFQFTE
jgi:hypothetical protein